MNVQASDSSQDEEEEEESPEFKIGRNDRAWKRKPKEQGPEVSRKKDAATRSRKRRRGKRKPSSQTGSPRTGEAKGGWATPLQRAARGRQQKASGPSLNLERERHENTRDDAISQPQILALSPTGACTHMHTSPTQSDRPKVPSDRNQETMPLKGVRQPLKMHETEPRETKASAEGHSLQKESECFADGDAGAERCCMAAASVPTAGERTKGQGAGPRAANERGEACLVSRLDRNQNLVGTQEADLQSAQGKSGSQKSTGRGRNDRRADSEDELTQGAVNDSLDMQAHCSSGHDKEHSGVALGQRAIADGAGEDRNICAMDVRKNQGGMPMDLSEKRRNRVKSRRQVQAQVPGRKPEARGKNNKLQVTALDKPMAKTSAQPDPVAEVPKEMQQGGDSRSAETSRPLLTGLAHIDQTTPGGQGMTMLPPGANADSKLGEFLNALEALKCSLQAGVPSDSPGKTSSDTELAGNLPSSAANPASARISSNKSKGIDSTGQASAISQGHNNQRGLPLLRDAKDLKTVPILAFPVASTSRVTTGGEEKPATESSLSHAGDALAMPVLTAMFSIALSFSLFLSVCAQKPHGFCVLFVMQIFPCMKGFLPSRRG